MQPYVFPYIGYFQLICATDIFVFYDDVNYINRGWINRNKILLNGKEQLFTIPCIDASQNKLITLKFDGGMPVSQLAVNSVINVCEYLHLQRSFKISSEEYDNRELKKADRLINICHIEGINAYINPSGGREIYSKEYYKDRGVRLDFLISDKVEYAQFNNAYVPWLSIIDILMFNSKDKINNVIMQSYHLE